MARLATPPELKENYALGQTLGRGTFGQVKLGTHVLTGEKVAVKILEKSRIQQIADVERVRREIKVLKRVRHPNVAQLYEVVDSSKHIFLIMEHLGGGELFQYIVRHGRLSEPVAARLFHDIVNGVDYLHQKRVSHRDLKPENLLLQRTDDFYTVKVIDFGLSNMFDDNRHLKTACGSPCYAAPEMIQGKRYDGSASDIWSIGVVLFAMVAGFLPFEHENTGKLYDLILGCKYTAPRHLSSACKDLIARVLRTDPTLRYTASDIRNHPWMRQSTPHIPPSLDPPQYATKADPVDPASIESSVVAAACELGADGTALRTSVEHGEHNRLTTLYFLLLKRQLREGSLPPAMPTSSQVPVLHAGTGSAGDGVRASGATRSRSVSPRAPRARLHHPTEQMPTREARKQPSGNPPPLFGSGAPPKRAQQEETGNNDAGKPTTEDAVADPSSKGSSPPNSGRRRPRTRAADGGLPSRTGEVKSRPSPSRQRDWTHLRKQSPPSPRHPTSTDSLSRSTGPHSPVSSANDGSSMAGKSRVKETENPKERETLRERQDANDASNPATAPASRDDAGTQAVVIAGRVSVPPLPLAPPLSSGAAVAKDTVAVESLSAWNHGGGTSTGLDRPSITAAVHESVTDEDNDIADDTSDTAEEDDSMEIAALVEAAQTHRAQTQTTPANIASIGASSRRGQRPHTAAPYAAVRPDTARQKEAPWSARSEMVGRGPKLHVRPNSARPNSARPNHGIRRHPLANGPVRVKNPYQYVPSSGYGKLRPKSARVQLGADNPRPASVKPRPRASVDVSVGSRGDSVSSSPRNRPLPAVRGVVPISFDMFVPRSEHRRPIIPQPPPSPARPQPPRGDRPLRNRATRRPPGRNAFRWRWRQRQRRSQRPESSETGSGIDGDDTSDGPHPQPPPPQTTTTGLVAASVQAIQANGASNRRPIAEYPRPPSSASSSATEIEWGPGTGATSARLVVDERGATSAAAQKSNPLRRGRRLVQPGSKAVEGRVAEAVQ